MKAVFEPGEAGFIPSTPDTSRDMVVTIPYDSSFTGCRAEIEVSDRPGKFSARISCEKICGFSNILIRECLQNEPQGVEEDGDKFWETDATDRTHRIIERYCQEAEELEQTTLVGIRTLANKVD